MLLQPQELLVGAQSPVAQPDIPVCVVTLVVPKASMALPHSELAWHRALHRAYENGFVQIGDPDENDVIFALGKIRSIDRSNPGDVRLEFWWWLVRLPGEPTSWVRGQLDEGCLHLDGRVSPPVRNTAMPQGTLFTWKLKFFWGMVNGWQYKKVNDYIRLTNCNLPPELQIRTDWECCDDPKRLIDIHM